jgi:hypothetical protein
VKDCVAGCGQTRRSGHIALEYHGGWECCFGVGLEFH